MSINGKPNAAILVLINVKNGCGEFITVLGRWLFLEKPSPRLLKTHIHAGLFYQGYRLIFVG
jgi:hypothetical protein